MQKSAEEEDCCCCCCPSCLGGGREKKYAGIRYELVRGPKPGQHRSFAHQQPPNPAVILPQDSQRLLPSDYLASKRPPPYIITQQPTGSNSPRYSPHRGLLAVDPNRTPSPTSSLSEDSVTPALTKLRSTARSPDMSEKSDTIDISQSPTGTFSSAYQRSQKRRSYGGSTVTTTRTSSSETETEIDTSSSSRGKVSNQSDSFGSDPDSIPVLQMSLYYHVESECLSVCLHGAQNLPPKKSKSYSLVLHLVPEKADKLEMKIVGDDPNPSLAQSFEISDIARDDVRQYKLMIGLHDGYSGGEVLGSAAIALEKTDLFGMICNALLETNLNKPRGELLTSLSFNSKTSVLQGILLKLTNIISTSDREIYVKIYLVYKGKRNKQWKSMMKQHKRTVIFNEAFQFDLRQKDAANAHLELCVMGYDRFSKDVELGKVLIGADVEHETGRQHWRQIIAQPQARISHWHTLTPGTSS